MASSKLVWPFYKMFQKTWSHSTQNFSMQNLRGTGWERLRKTPMVMAHKLWDYFRKMMKMAKQNRTIQWVVLPQAYITYRVINLD